jgi:hypothetical protein
MTNRLQNSPVMKAKLIGALLVCGFFSYAPVQAQLDLGSATSRTPYDQYLGPMWSVFGRLSGGQPGVGLVEQLVRQGKSFRYVFKASEPYAPQSPDVTESTKSGDCKAKSLWLASKMDTKKVRYVIGKAKAGSNLSHAWIIWDGPEGWLVLDATFYSRPLSPQRLSSNEFIPIYSYSPGGRYAHTVSAAGRGVKNGDHL